MRKIILVLLLISSMFVLSGCSPVASDKLGEANNVKLIKKVGDVNNSIYFLIVQKNTELMQFKTSGKIYQSLSDNSLVNITYDKDFYAYQVIPVQFNDN